MLHAVVELNVALRPAAMHSERPPALRRTNPQMAARYAKERENRGAAFARALLRVVPGRVPPERGIGIGYVPALR